MTFQLEVEFAGLCFYLLHPDNRQIGVVMPDARLHDLNVTPEHDDGEPAKPHVGYLRYDLADAGANVPAGPRDDPDLGVEHPQYEVVHLFDFEELDLGLGFDELLDPPQLEVAELEKYTQNVVPLPNMFTANPPAELLMRTILRGGRIVSKGDSDAWFFDDLLNPGTRYTGRFHGTAVWTRRVHAENLTLRIKNFNGDEKVAITLTPRSPQRVVKLKIANLCADNPLEWEELPMRKTSLAQPDDDDYKWFYHLVAPPPGTTFRQLTKGAGKLLPHPILDPLAPNNLGGGANCGSKKASFKFT